MGLDMKLEVVECWTTRGVVLCGRKLEHVSRLESWHYDSQPSRSLYHIERHPNVLAVSVPSCVNVVVVSEFRMTSPVAHLDLAKAHDLAQKSAAHLHQHHDGTVNAATSIKQATWIASCINKFTVLLTSSVSCMATAGQGRYRHGLIAASADAARSTQLDGSSPML